MKIGAGQIHRHGRAAILLRYDVPTYYVSRELLAAGLRTEPPDDMVKAIPFSFDALVFMLPKATVRHAADGDCPFLVLARTTKGGALSLPTRELDFSVTNDGCASPKASRKVMYPLRRPSAASKLPVQP